MRKLLFFTISFKICYSLSIFSSIRFLRNSSISEEVSRVKEPLCSGDCGTCMQILANHSEEILKACQISKVGAYDQMNWCWDQYIGLKCEKEYARKYCQQCDLFYAFEIYINDYIAYHENGECIDYPSQQCRKNSTSETITDLSPMTSLESTTMSSTDVWTSDTTITQTSVPTASDFEVTMPNDNSAAFSMKNNLICFLIISSFIQIII